MTQFQRLHARCEFIVNISAETFFEALIEWDSIAAWETPPLPMREVRLFPGHVNRQVPCTRLCFPDLDRLPEGVAPDSLPAFISETILQLDQETRFVLYRLDGEGPLGLRNYIATTEVDAIDAGQARVICTGRGDLPAEVPVGIMQSMLETTYAEGIIKGTVAIAKRRIGR